MVGRRKRKEGATLIEVGFALLLLAFIAAAAVTVLRYPRYRAVADTYKQAAVTAATSVLEEAVSWGYISASNAPGTYVIGNLATKYPLSGSSLSGTRVVTELNDSETKRITVTISYLGTEAPVVLETLLANE